MSNYYSKQDAKIRIAHELMNRGWNVEGYHADESDSMTDYYSPAYWNGIATKNGFVLVVDNRYDAKATEITKYNPKGNLSFDDKEKISKLEQMTIERGCTAGEEENAKKLIEKIQSKITGESQYEVVGMTTAHMGNPKGSIWHIEKDGKIYDKGNGLTKFSDMPSEYEFDIVKMEYTDRYKKVWTRDDENGCRVMEDRVLPEETRKTINDFKALILRFERVVNNMNGMGDGTKETEQKAAEQQGKIGYELKTVTETKTGLKMIEVTDRKYIKVGDYIKTSHYSCYWKVTHENMRTGTWKGIKEEKKAFTYEQVGKESRGFQALKNAQRYYDYEFRMLKDIEAGNTKIYELKEVEESIQVEKWVKIDKTKKTYNTTKKEEQKPETETKQIEQIEIKENILNHEITITADTDTRDNSFLWVVKLVNKVDYEEFKRIEKDIMKPIKGYYSRFKGGFIFKYDPTSILKNEQQQEQTAEQTQEENKTDNNDSYTQPEIKDGFIYDCHFKSWDIPINEIQKTVTALNIPFIDWGEKIGFKRITAEQTRQLKEISDINKSIFFIDVETPEIITEEQPEQGKTEITDNVIDFKEYKNNNEVEEIKKETITEQQEEQDEDIFSKFDNIEINNNNRISLDDEEFCKNQENQYKQFIEFSNNYIEYLKNNSLSNMFLNSESLINEMNEKRQNNKNWFIEKIVSYFRDTYKVTLKYEPIQNKYDLDITYNTIIDEIIEQLDGYSFTDKAGKEIKDALKKQITRGYDNNVRAEIKNKKVIFDDFFWIDSWDKKYGTYKVSYSSDEAFLKLLKAISHFEQGANENTYHGVYETITRKRNDEVFKEHTLMCIKAESIKLFKNGKVEVTFLNNEYARQFAKEYCGYIEKSA